MLPLVELTYTTTCTSDSTNSFFLDLLNTSSHAYDFEIPLKGFKSSVVVDLVVATRFHQHLIINLIPIDTCRVRRLQNLTDLTGVTQKSSRSLQNIVRVFLSYLEVLDWNPKHFHGIGLDLNFVEFDFLWFWSFGSNFWLVELHRTWTLLSTAWMFFNLDLYNLEQCLAPNLDMFLFSICKHTQNRNLNI